MTWLFSKALMMNFESSRSSLGPGVESSVENFSAGGRCVLWNPPRTPRASWLPVKMTEPLTLSPSGMTFELLKDGRGEELLTWFRAGFPARTFRPRVKAKASTVSVQACGEKWRVSLARFDHALHSWRTPQGSLLAGLDVFSETWPPSGTMRSGVCWVQTMLGLLTCENAFGFLLPTLTASEGGHNQSNPNGKVRLTLSQLARKGMLPTLRASDASKGGNPTGASVAHGDLRLGGPLNPQWAEWFMGWPIGWTELKPLETGRFQAWLDWHGKSCGKR
jgi:hypothetical protein